ncbi:MAG: hypothetical protein P8X95_27910 [Anaerolineales bacterium]
MDKAFKGYGHPLVLSGGIVRRGIVMPGNPGATRRMGMRLLQ